MKKTILIAESGADIPPELAKAYGIHVLPMHVMINGENLDDGHFPVSLIFDCKKRTRKLPTTSATNPHEYKELFERLHKAYPDCQLVHLCYSAVTTATYQNALIASEGMSYVTHVDTKNVSGGQAAIVLKMAKYLEEKPDAPLKDVLSTAERWISSARMSFIPGDLEYLRAGGRVSNAAYLGASILSLKPCIEIIDGKLVCNKKYRGSMENTAKKLIEEFIALNQPEKSSLFFIYSEGLSEKIKQDAVEQVQSLGYPSVLWIKAGGVISTHSGPGAFGIGGFGKD